jgi:2-polyprenyl-6-methoxyphenol hydroxylase-like FAD-dependent oxidoreductase
MLLDACGWQFPAYKYRNGWEGVNVSEKGSKVEVWSRPEGGERESIGADLVIEAGGASSAVRQILLPNSTRTCSGYAIQRGLVPIGELSGEKLAAFNDAGVMCCNDKSQIFSYNASGNGTTIAAAGQM